MSSTINDLLFSTISNFEMQPIGIKFLLFKPDSIRKLEKKLALCEMIREAKNQNLSTLRWIISIA